jgi:zinc transport system substrate-binding protein
MRPLALVLAVALAASAAGCLSSGGGGGGLRVAATIYPLYDMAKAVGGNGTYVVLLVTPGAEVHGFEPTPEKAAMLSEADLLIVNGLGLEPWAGKLASSSGNGRLAFADASEGIEPIMYGGSADPHVFEDPVLAQTQLSNVLSAFQRLDPGNSAAYARNAEAYRARLVALDAEYASALSNCSTRAVIVNHAFLAYPARRYGFVQHPLSGMSPEAEPRPGDIGAAVAAARDEGARYVLYEAAMPDRAAQAAAREAGIGTMQMPMAHEVSVWDYNSGKTYPQILHEQLGTLGRAMGCG